MSIYTTRFSCCVLLYMVGRAAPRSEKYPKIRINSFYCFSVWISACAEMNGHDLLPLCSRCSGLAVGTHDSECDRIRSADIFTSRSCWAPCGLVSVIHSSFSLNRLAFTIKHENCKMTQRKKYKSHKYNTKAASESLRADVRKQKNKWELYILLFLPLKEREWGQKENGKVKETVTYICANMYAITLDTNFVTGEQHQFSFWHLKLPFSPESIFLFSSFSRCFCTKWHQAQYSKALRHWKSKSWWGWNRLGRQDQGRWRATNKDLAL